MEKAKEIVRLIKDSKIRVQASIQEKQVRVAGKNRDDLQAVIALAEGQGARHRAPVHELPLDLTSPAGEWSFASLAAVPAGVSDCGH